MHSGVHADRSSWRIPPDETLQVADPKAKKAEVGDEEDENNTECGEVSGLNAATTVIVENGEKDECEPKEGSVVAISGKVQASKFANTTICSGQCGGKTEDKIHEQQEHSKELALHDDEGHNWWSIIFSLLVIGLVVSGIVAAIFFVGYVDELLYWHGRRMKLEEYLQGDLTPRRLPSSWISPKHFVFQADDGSLSILKTGNNISVTVLVTNHTLRQLNVKGYQCSNDLKYVLFQHNIKSVFRQSFTAHYTIYDVDKDHHIPLRLEQSPKTQPERLQYAKWLGDSNSILMVYNNDIYLRQSPLFENDTRLTFTGQPDVIYNGIPDWLYQEDVLKNPEALWSSYDNTHILYASFNDSEVGLLNFPWFSTTHILAGKSNHKPSFPNYRTIRYPTPGSINPKVQLYVLDISNITDLQRYLVNPPKAFVGQDYYLTSAGWIGHTNNQLSVVWMNRAQNLSIVSSCLAPNWTCVEIHAERAFERAWLEIQEHPTFSPDGDSFLVLAPVQEGNTETYTHIKHVVVTRQHIAVLSYGRHEVDRILSWDTFNNLIYYLATEENKPGQRHLFVVRDPTIDDPRRLESHCITCDLGGVLWSSRYLYGNCTHFNAFVSPRTESSNNSFYVLQCEGPGLPLAGVHNATSHRLLKVLYDTRPTHLPPLGDLALPKLKFLEVPLPQGHRAQVQMLLPPSWREELRDAAYPVLVEVNGRPGSKAVTDVFEVDWGTYMSSHSDVVYMKLDVRGASGLTDRALYHQFGGVEVQDQVSVLEYMFEKFKYLDKSRVGLWGWGYGGYVTAMVMGLGNQQKVYKCGISVSPISDWLFYNSAFTERILGLPADNYKGYVESDATQRAKNIPKRSFFLIHGMADLTTPYQHGVQLARALTDAGILFRYQSYADEGHELKGVLEHVYRSMQEFFEECLSLESDMTIKEKVEDT